jgi:hypothetical protein
VLRHALGPAQAELGEIVLALEFPKPRQACGSGRVDFRSVEVAPVAHVPELGAQLFKVIGMSHEVPEAVWSRSFRTS